MVTLRQTAFLLWFLLVGCTQGSARDYCAHQANGNKYYAAIDANTLNDALQTPVENFPKGFHWGTATAAYQIESGNHQSDWYQWEQLGKIKDQDRADDGPQAERFYKEDIQRMVEMGLNSYRLSIEWGRLFPTRESFDAEPPMPDATALAYYRDLLQTLHDNNLQPMVTLQHFSLPSWLAKVPSGDEMTGLLSDGFAADLKRFAHFSAEQFGDLVDYWITINEPVAVLSGGFVGGNFPPGRFLDFEGMKLAYKHVLTGHVRAYDAIRRSDLSDADGDGKSALISFATHNRAWLPTDPQKALDVSGARRLRYISNLALLDASVCGNVDFDFDENWEITADTETRAHLDFIALNFYGTAAVTGIEGVEPYKGLPILGDIPNGLPKSDFGWDLIPEALLPVLAELEPYGLPIYISENGLADAADTRRGKFIADTLAIVQVARARGYDVRGYYHWSLLDNFEWDSGFCPSFGLFSVDRQSPNKTRTERSSADVLSQIVRDNTVEVSLRTSQSYGATSLCGSH